MIKLPAAPAHYYNDNGIYAIRTIKTLQWRGMINEDVELITDKREIQTVAGEVGKVYGNQTKTDLKRCVQAHWFCGIGGWTRALQLAGWKDEWPIWTASCPCQPFSVSGKQEGFLDSRHVWPHLFTILNLCRSPCIVGEQVAGKAGEDWFDRVRLDLESAGYQARAVSIPACAVNAPHRRDRLWWVGVREKEMEAMADTANAGRHERGQEAGRTPVGEESTAAGSCALYWGNYDTVGPDQTGNHWRTKPGVRVLADGVRGRVAKLHSLGNAIVPQVGALVVRSLMEEYGLA